MKSRSSREKCDEGNATAKMRQIEAVQPQRRVYAEEDGDSLDGFARQVSSKMRVLADPVSDDAKPGRKPGGWEGSTTSPHRTIASNATIRKQKQMEEKKLYTIQINGCDDSTEFTMPMTEKEVRFLEMVCKLSTETSTYGCMPTMQVELCDSSKTNQP